ncbi:MAG TPA: flagellar motor switch protein FliG [Armatimonadota bacterium]|nr:flagellar motor switch protein FliG [Armatimonadota bacterium]
MSARDIKDLTGLEKASILLVALGTNIAAQVFKHLTESEIERLSAQIIKLENVDRELMDAVIGEFEQLVTNSMAGAQGGKDFAAQVLEQVVGGEKASELLVKAGSPVYNRPFESLWGIDTSHLARMLSKEHPQVAALVLTYLPSEKAAAVLSEFTEELQTEVAHRICMTTEPDPEALAAIEEALQVKASAFTDKPAVTAGPKALVEILNSVTRPTERNVLETLANQDPNVAEEVRSMMFVFEDLPKLEDRTVQVVLREIDQEDLRLALKGADDVLKDLIFKNMSERAAEMLKEDLELITNVRAKDVEAAQQKIVYVVRRLLASGEAMLRNSDDVVVEGTAEEESSLESSYQEDLAA